MIKQIHCRPEGSFADDDCLVVADTHVHIYPCHDLERFFQAAFDQLDQLSRSASRHVLPHAMLQVLFLAERADCHFFRDLAKGGVLLPESTLEAEQTDEPEGVIISRGESSLLLIEGYQVVTCERLEVLALATPHRPADGLGLEEAVLEIIEADGIPVLPWAPGKWMFQRGRMLRALLQRADPSEVFLGDTTLRPTHFPVPSIMRSADRRNFTTLHGSDPRPFPGEENRVGSYASAWVQPMSANYPVDALRQFLRLALGAPQPFGRRSSLPTVFFRLLRNHRATQQAKEPVTDSD